MQEKQFGFMGQQFSSEDVFKLYELFSGQDWQKITAILSAYLRFLRQKNDTILQDDLTYNQGKIMILKKLLASEDQLQQHINSLAKREHAGKASHPN